MDCSGKISIPFLIPILNCIYVQEIDITTQWCLYFAPISFTIFNMRMEISMYVYTGICLIMLMYTIKVYTYTI